MKKFLILGLIPLLLMVPGTAFAADFTINESCEEEYFVLSITNNETGENVQNVNAYTLDGREIVEKFVSDDQGVLKILKSKMTGMIKLSKGGYNDLTIGSDCYIRGTSQPIEDREEYTNYGQDSYTKKSQEDLINFCDSNYEMYKLLGPQEFLKMNTDSLSGTYARKCIILYQSEIWPYDGDDRIQVLNKWLEEYSIKQASNTQTERTQNTIEARMAADTSVNTSLSVQQLEKRIEFLEKQLEEKDKQLANKDAILMEQMKVIQQLASSFKKTIFEPISHYFGFA